MGEVGQMEKASSWSVLNGVPASLVMAPTLLLSPYHSSQGASWGSRGYLKGFIRAHLWTPGTNFACTPPPQENDRHKNSSQPNPDHSDPPVCHTAEAPSKVSF